MIERIGKNAGVSIGGTPKYLQARSPSNLAYAALAGRVQGGLFPFVLVLGTFHGVNVVNLDDIPEPTLIPPRKTGWNLVGY
jgi:hypothetical protein